MSKSANMWISRRSSLVILWIALATVVTVTAQSEGGRRYYPSNNGRNYVRNNYNSSAPQTTVRVSNNVVLDRLNEKISALNSLDEQLLKKLENIEYKLAQLQVLQQDRSDATTNELKEISRGTHNLDETTLRINNEMEQLRYELETLRAVVGSMDQQQSSSSKRDIFTTDNFQDELMKSIQSSTSNTELHDTLSGISTLLTSARFAIKDVDQLAQVIAANMTELLHGFRELRQRQHSLPTKQFIHSAIQSLRSQPSVYTVLQGQSGNGHADAIALPRTCEHEAAFMPSSITKVQVNSYTEPFYVTCDGEIDGGGWTVIQRRQSGLINFNRPWLEYKFGFGNLAGEFFIGLDKLHLITSTTLHELMIIMTSFKGEKKFARYRAFAIGSEKEFYPLNILGSYDGTAGDSLTYSASYKFSTFDNDNDGWVEGNCAQAHSGAWWYNACEMSNLNGKYLTETISPEHKFTGIYWNTFNGPLGSLQNVTMMIRPLQSSSALK